MNTATLIVSIAGLVVSATTLVIVVVALRRGGNMIAEVSIQAEEKVNALKRAVAEL